MQLAAQEFPLAQPHFHLGLKTDEQEAIPKAAGNSCSPKRPEADVVPNKKLPHQANAFQAPLMPGQQPIHGRPKCPRTKVGIIYEEISLLDSGSELDDDFPELFSGPAPGSNRVLTPMAVISSNALSLGHKTVQAKSHSMSSNQAIESKPNSSARLSGRDSRPEYRRAIPVSAKLGPQKPGLLKDLKFAPYVPVGKLKDFLVRTHRILRADKHENIVALVQTQEEEAALAEQHCDPSASRGRKQSPASLPPLRLVQGRNKEPFKTSYLPRTCQELLRNEILKPLSDAKPRRDENEAQDLESRPKSGHTSVAKLSGTHVYSGLNTLNICVAKSSIT